MWNPFIRKLYLYRQLRYGEKTAWGELGRYKKRILLDIDLSPPSIPVRNVNDYDGSNQKKRDWLEKFRPKNWLREWRKSPDMSAASGGRRSIRLRRLSEDLVIPERVCYFISKGGNK